MLALVLAALCAFTGTDTERDSLVLEAAALEGITLRSDDGADIYDDLAEQGFDLACPAPEGACSEVDAHTLDCTVGGAIITVTTYARIEG